MYTHDTTMVNMALWSLDSKTPKKVLDEFYDWFVSQLPKATVYLRERHKAANVDICLDCSVESLIPLSRWFETAVTTRPITPEEREASSTLVLGKHTVRREVDDWMLTDDTLIMCIEVGIYLGNVCVANDSDAYWRRLLKPKNLLDYGKVVVQLGEKAPRNPIVAAHVTALKIVEKTVKENALHRLYHVWKFPSSNIAI